jgi:hypothetical protein
MLWAAFTLAACRLSISENVGARTLHDNKSQILIAFVSELVMFELGPSIVW